LGVEDLGDGDAGGDVRKAVGAIVKGGGGAWCPRGAVRIETGDGEVAVWRKSGAWSRSWGVGKGRPRKWGSVCVGPSWSHTGLRGITTLRRRETFTLESVWPGAHDRGGALRRGTQSTASLDLSLPSSDRYLRFRSANGRNGRTQSTV